MRRVVAIQSGAGTCGCCGGPIRATHHQGWVGLGDPADDVFKSKLEDPADDVFKSKLEDPADDVFKSKLEDPADDEFKSKLEDPADDEFKSKLEDPSWGGGWGGPGAHGGAGGRGCCCAAPVIVHCGGEGDEETKSPWFEESDYSGQVIVRLVAGILPKGGEATLRELAERYDLAGLLSLLDEMRAERGGEQDPGSQPIIDLAKRYQSERWATAPRGSIARRPKGKKVVEDDSPVPDRPDTLVEAILSLEHRASMTSFPPLHSLASSWRLDSRFLGGDVHGLVTQLNTLPEVDLAYAEVRATDPQSHAQLAAPSASAAQGFWDDAPAGTGGRWARQWVDEAALKADPRQLVDVEQGWIFNHVELANKIHQPALGQNRHQPGSGYQGHHGTAVFGQLLSDGSSMTTGQGILAGLYDLKAESHYHAITTTAGNVVGSTGHVALAIVGSLLGLAGTPALGAGDVLLLEVQRGRLPTEIDPVDLDAIRLASALGVTVIEAAGNGGHLLDLYADEEGRRRLSRTSGQGIDSGAVLVGAARAALPHERLSSSNHGSRLDCYGWGDSVCSCGFGDFCEGGGDMKKQYTNTFNGTSSASPIIAGAAVLVHCLYFQTHGMWISPIRMRGLLADRRWGTPQGSRVPGHIGVMPDLRVLATEGLGLGPAPCIRRFIGDEGQHRGPVTSSPDIIVAARGSKATGAAFAAGGIHEDEPAPGGVVRPGERSLLRLRLRNRGSLPVENPTVSFYAAPAATLLTPELWETAGSLPPDAFPNSSIAPGGALQVSEARDWNGLRAARKHPAAATPAILALLSSEAGAAPPIPPGAPYFQWGAFRSFLRDHDAVACRNVHHIPTRAGKELALHFLVTGTPDRARHFDLEVLQNMPVGLRWELTGAKALLALLHQRHPWMPYREAGAEEALTLPTEPSLRFRHILLPAAARHAVRWVLKGAQSSTSAPGAGHSLAIRQLWQGEEVGRVTWTFELA